MKLGVLENAYEFMVMIIEIPQKIQTYFLK